MSGLLFIAVILSAPFHLNHSESFADPALSGSEPAIADFPYGEARTGSWHQSTSAFASVTALAAASTAADASISVFSSTSVATAGAASQLLSDGVTVRGIVRDAATQSPVLRARVNFYDAGTGAELLTGVFTGEDGSFETTLAVEVSIDEPGTIASEYWVGSIYPNPVSSTDRITLEYTTPGNEPETPLVEIFDVLGRRVLPASRLATGVYFYRVRFDNNKVTETRRFL
ncbi:MAG: T9SS C-terminal target domain-containing protein, partial [Balneolaceae bacterium]